MFVCTGNICRSPTAERLASAHSTKLGMTGFSTSSAGIRAVIGHPIHPKAVKVLEDLGGDPNNFAAQQLTPRIAGRADLILVMTKEHRDAVLETAPNKLRRTFTLGEAAQLVSVHGAHSLADLAAMRSHLTNVELLDVPDPIGSGADFFGAVGSQIAKFLSPVLEMCHRSASPSFE